MRRIRSDGQRSEKTKTRIAIDGPVGAGKTTAGRLLAKRLGCRFLDTGIMYRALTRAAIDGDIALDDEAAIRSLAEGPAIEYVFDESGDVRVDIGGADETVRLRSPDVDAGVSAVSALPGVRAVAVAQQRAMAGEAPIVMVGRDIGTVVLADAELKVFLIASPEERALRRFQENERNGIGGTYEEILEGMIARDALDSGRAASPLKAAEDSVVVDSDGKTIDEVVEEIATLAEARR